jgi:3',5'-cyclic AMP phosphodiesterase CpdA
MGTRKKTGIVLLLLAAFVGRSCKEIDPTGFLYSSDPVNERVEQSLEWNDMHPARKVIVSGTEYSLLVAADSHLDGIVNLDTLISRAQKPNNAGYVMVGDLTTGRKESYSLLIQELSLKNKVPAFLMVGNHDLFYGGWDTFYNYFGSSTYAFRVTGKDTTDLYICLDSGSGTIGSMQLDWLKNLLEKERSRVRYCILFSHVNFFREHRTTSTNPLVDEIRVLMDLCYVHSVDMVIMGHDHRRSTETFGKTRFITLDALQDGFEEASYLKLDIKENGLEYTFIDL